MEEKMNRPQVSLRILRNPRILLPTLAAVIIVLGALILAYNLLEKRAFNKGIEAFEDGGYTGAIQQFHQVTHFYRLTFRKADVERAANLMGESSLLMKCIEQHQTGDYSSSAACYQAYKSAFPNGEKAGEVDDLILTITRQWAEDQTENGFLNGAILAYQSLVDTYPGTEEATESRIQIAAIYLAKARVEAQDGELVHALEQYRLIVDHYADTPSIIPALEEAASIHAELGKKYRQERKFETAIQHYRAILEMYPDTTPAHTAREDIGECFLDWAQYMFNANRYQVAIDLYTTLLLNWADTSAATTAETALPDIYGVWADGELEDGKYASAVSLYDLLNQRYPGSPAADTARSALPQVYLTWANSLISQDDLAGAITILTTLANRFPDTPQASEASQLIDSTYTMEADTVMDQGDYIGAMERYSFVQIFGIDAASRANAGERYQAALETLAADTEGQGRAIFSNTYTNACNYRGTDSIALDIDTAGPGRGLVCGDNYELPEELVATAPIDFRFVVRFTSGIEEIETCTYGENRIIRQRQYWTFSIYHTSTGSEYLTRRFDGPNPKKCPILPIIIHSPVYYLGDPPDKTEVDDWLRSVFGWS